MRNLDEQASTQRPALIAVFTILLFAAYCVLILLPGLGLNLLGFTVLPKEVAALVFPAVPPLELNTFTLDLGSKFAYIGYSAILFSLFVIAPLLACAAARAKKNRTPAFGTGINFEEFDKTARTVFPELINFVQSNGALTVKHGFGSEEIFTPNGEHFASISLQKGVRNKFFKKSLYVLFDRDIVRDRKDLRRPDRTGYIPIPYVEDLESAKERIYSEYLYYFKRHKATQTNIPNIPLR
ncbi:MAG: hypothetical protein LBN25_04460 [Christensenellaceae bacterium]|jgi:hypothetical protein|nr:hypothetical protein [Christensenellaceae bacterium]